LLSVSAGTVWGCVSPTGMEPSLALTQYEFDQDEKNSRRK
jgi:hypothetical protein